MIWDQLTSVQIEKLDKNLPVILVMAATEQHGPHLPLATDRLIGEYFAQKIDESLPEKVLILPAVSVGCSDHHMMYAGTLSLDHRHFAGQVLDMVRSVIQHGFKKIILLNSHGGNQGIGQVLIERLGREFPEARFVLTSWWKIAGSELEKITDTGPGGTGHGGEFETSLMMLIAPDLVIHEAIKPKSNVPTFPWAEGDMLQSPRAVYYRPLNKMTSNGVFGDPTAATVEKGEKITVAVLKALKQVVDELYQRQH